jgi:hypothetical protein
MLFKFWKNKGKKEDNTEVGVFADAKDFSTRFAWSK